MLPDRFQLCVSSGLTQIRTLRQVGNFVAIISKSHTLRDSLDRPAADGIEPHHLFGGLSRARGRPELESISDGAEEVCKGPQRQILASAQALGDERFRLPQTSREVSFGNIVFVHNRREELGRIENEFFLLEKFLVDIEKFLKSLHFSFLPCQVWWPFRG